MRWVPGVTIGDASAVFVAWRDRRNRSSRRRGIGHYDLEWSRIGASTVPICGECGAVLDGENGALRHDYREEQIASLITQVNYLYDHLGIDQEGTQGDGESAPAADGHIEHDYDVRTAGPEQDQGAERDG